MKKRLCLMLILLIIFFAVFRIVKVTHKFRIKDTTIYQIGETIEIENMAMKVTDMRFMTKDDLKQYQELIGEDCDKSMCIVLSVDLKNLLDQETKNDLTFLSMASGAWTQQISYEMFHALNQENASLNLTLQSEQSMQLQLPFILASVQFKDKDWANIQDRDYQLYISLYPEKRLVQLN